MEFTGKVVKIDGEIYFKPSNYIDKNKCLEEFEDGDLTKLKTSKPRSIKEHGYFYRLLTVAVDAGILDNEFVFHDIIEVNHEMIQAYRAAYKNDEEVLRKIMALAFLPLDETLNAWGKVVQTVASISFAKRDSDQFKKFLSDCIAFVASETKIDEKELDMMIRRER